MNATTRYRGPLAAPLRGLFALLSALVIAGAAFAQSGGAADKSAQSPDALIRDLSNDVLETIRNDKALQSGDIDRLQKLVDEKVLPHVNFEKMTQRAVGRGWRQATPEQRQALIREFRTLLVRTYAGAVSAVRDHQIQMKPFRGQANDTDVIVRTAVVASRGEPIQLDYRLEKSEGGAWKIYDVNVLGIWLVENYRNTFTSEINARGIDGLVKWLTERNRELANPAKKS